MQPLLKTIDKIEHQNGEERRFNGHLLYKIHFNMLFKHKCVLGVSKQPPFNDKNPPVPFFLSPHIISSVSERAVCRICQM